MTRKTNIPSTSRDIYFSQVGKSEASGFSPEVPVSSPAEALAVVGTLLPVPDGSNPASINAAITGSYTDNLTLVDNTTAQCRFASLLNFVPFSTSITAASTQESVWGAILLLSDNSVGYDINGQVRHAAILNALVLNNAGTTGFNVTGSCDDIFVSVVQVEQRGLGSTLVDHTATSTSPINYHFELIETFADNTTLIKYNPVAGSKQTIIEMTTAQKGSGPATTGCSLFEVEGGILVVDAEVLECDMISHLTNGSILTLKSQVIAGDTLVDSSICIYKSLSLLTGDLETTGTGSLQVDATNIVGTATNAVGCAMTLRCESFIGEIVNNGAMLVNVGAYTGTLPVDDGSINGVINGIHYGNWKQAIADIEGLQTELDSKLENGDNVSELVNDAGYLTSETPAPVSSVNGETGVVVLDTGDISEVTDKKYTTDAQQTVLGNTSGTNTGDQDLSGLAPIVHTHVEADITDLGTYSTDIHGNIAALDAVSGTNTGDQDLSGLAPIVHTHVKADITDFSDGDYATAAQGTLADSALQNGDNVSELVNDAGYLTSSLGYVLATWGANLQTVGRHPAINSPSNSAEITSLGIMASMPVPAAGTMDTLTYYNTTGDATTELQIIKNGAVVHTFTCTGFYGVETGINVPIGLVGGVPDNIAIRYSAGTAPSGGLYTMYVN